MKETKQTEPKYQAIKPYYAIDISKMWTPDDLAAMKSCFGICPSVRIKAMKKNLDGLKDIAEFMQLNVDAIWEQFAGFNSYGSPDNAGMEALTEAEQIWARILQLQKELTFASGC